MECKQLHWISEFWPSAYWFEYTTARDKPIVWSCWKYNSLRAIIIDRTTHHNPPNECWSYSTFGPNARGHGGTLSFTLRTRTTFVLFPIVGGSNVPLHPFTSYGQGQPQYQQAPQTGPFIPSSSYQQPIVGAGNTPLAPQSGWHQPGGIYAPGGAQNIGPIPFAGGFNPSQQSGYAAPYTNQPGGYNQYPGQMGSNPQ